MVLLEDQENFGEIILKIVARLGTLEFSRVSHLVSAVGFYHRVSLNSGLINRNLYSHQVIRITGFGI